MSVDMKNVPSIGTHTSGTVASKADKAAASGGAGPGLQGPNASSGPVGDSVNLTQAGMQLAQMEKELAKQPAVDAQRIAQVRQKLQSGSYTINPTRIANKLLGLEFPSKP